MEAKRWGTLGKHYSPFRLPRHMQQFFLHVSVALGLRGPWRVSCLDVWAWSIGWRHLEGGRSRRPSPPNQHDVISYHADPR